MKTICLHGRQPALGRAELESLYGTDALVPIGEVATGVALEPQTIDFSRLGGTVKFCKLLTIIDTTDWNELKDYLAETIPKHLGYVPEGKMKLGLSLYGFDVTVTQINTAALELKKIIQATGRSIRVVPNKETALNSAQVLHNQLTSALGWELVFIRDGHRTILAQNIAEQDIEAYGARDQRRPKRDARVGMLPPKLAQIIINLAHGLAEPVDPSCGPHEPKGQAVLDPFCGTGVLLQEALLMGYDAYGTDIEERMVEYSKHNLDWLATHYNLDGLQYLLETGDATSFTWQPFDFLAAESYLGRPFSTEPKTQLLQEVIQDVDTINRKFLKNLAKQTTAGFRLCIALPAWKTKQGFQHLKLLESLGELGYTRVSFNSVSSQDLIYHRENQVVARELVVLVRN